MSYASRKHWKSKSSGFGYAEKRRSPVRKIILFVVLLFIVYQVITSLFIISYKLDSISMEPTIPSEAVVLASPLIYGPEIPFAGIRVPGLRSPRRGDLVVSSPGFHSDKPWYRSLLDSIYGFFTLQKKNSGEDGWVQSSIVKRVIGVPGDTVKMENNTYFIKPSGKNFFFAEDEIIQIEYETLSYSRPGIMTSEFPFSGNMEEIVLGENEYFLSGDNRSMTNDSYYWGPVGIENIRAKILLEYAPEINILQ